MKKLYLVALIALTLLTLVSLVLNGIVIFGLLRAQMIALDAQQAGLGVVTEARSAIAAVGDDTFAYTFEVKQDVPVETSVPFREEVIVPIRATIPISTMVIIPVNTGLLGTFDIDVPVRTLIPVNLDLTVPISHTVDIATVVPLDVDVPIEIVLAETPLVDYIDELDTGLASLEEALVQLEEKLTIPPDGRIKEWFRIP